MQITLNPCSVAEYRLLAAFMQDYADLVELEREQLGRAGVLASQPVVVVADETPAAEDKPKRTRAKKTTTEETVQADAEAVPAETEVAVEEAPAEAEPAPAQEEAVAVTHDTLRVLFGELSQAGKRDQAIAVVRGKGYNSIKDIKEEDLSAVFADLRAL